MPKLEPVSPATDPAPADTPPAPATESAAPGVIDLPMDVKNLALTILAVIATVWMLQFAQTVLIPVVIGVLISFALGPMVTAMARARIPRALGAAVAVATLVGGLGLAVYTLSDEVMSIVRSVPDAAQKVTDRLRERRGKHGGALQDVQEAAKEIDKVSQAAAQQAPAAPRQPGVTKVEVIEPGFKATDFLWTGGVSLIGFAAQLLLVLFLVYFILVTGDLYKRKLVKITGTTLSEKKVTVQLLDEIAVQIEGFMRVQLFTSFIVGTCTGLALWWFGVDQPIVWGLLAGIFNSIPYIGPVLVTGSLGVVTFVQFDDVLKTSYVGAVVFAITSLEGFVLTPMLMSRAASMNPVAIFVGLLFWSWIWGIAGTILAVPMLMMLKAICDHVEDLRPVGELLGE